jgi:hypothetical protein
MDSLPDQRIEDLPGATRQEAYWKLAVLSELRRRRYSEHEIAKRAEFGGVEAMHQQLKTWGLTGLLPSEKAGEEPPKAKRPKARQEHKARSSGPPEEVPDASAAAELFKEALDQLRGQVELLEHLSLVYQGGTSLALTPLRATGLISPQTVLCPACTLLRQALIHRLSW